MYRVEANHFKHELWEEYTEGGRERRRERKGREGGKGKEGENKGEIEKEGKRKRISGERVDESGE